MTRTPRHTPVTLSALVLILSLSSLSSAPISAQETTENDSTVVYPATYFSEYAPLTAQDMLNRIPGVGSATGGGGGGPGGGGGNPGGGGRGLGGGGGDQVLINGKRSAGKNNDTRGMLTRINADQVDRIEIIRGTSSAQTSYQYSTNLSYELTPNSSVRLNGLYGQNDNPTDVSRVTTNLRVNPRTLSYEREEIPGERDNWEIGGDYEYLTANGSRFKALFITNENDGSSIRERYRVNADGSETKNLFLDSGSVSKERIVRSSYTMGLFDGQDIEFGVERAQTILDSNLRLGLASSTGTPSAAYGGLVPQVVSNANSMVEEIRYEPFAVHNWQINPRMSLESTLVWETSEITQTGDVYNQRSFDFWKPKVDYRFDITSNFQLRAMAEYNVRQLSFSDFVAASDNQDNDENTQAGNSNLEPETFINADLDAEYRLPDDIGVVTATINFMRHYDKIERIDVSSSPTNLESANGNIGTGDMWQFSVRSSIRMKMINMPNLLVTANFQVRDSEIEDPFLGIDRRFTNYERGRLDMGFRHDVPRYNMNWGLSWNNRFDGNIKRYDIDDIEMTSGDPMVMAFVEFIRFNGITFRFDARNATDNLQCRERQRFVGHISAGVLEEIEDQCGGSGRVLSLKINGSF